MKNKENEHPLAPIICMKCASLGKTDFKGDHNILCPAATKEGIEISGQKHISSFTRDWKMVQILMEIDKNGKDI